MSSLAPAHSRSCTETIIPWDGGRILTNEYVACIHCEFSWKWKRGSGRARPFCLTCMGYCCGRPWCVKRGCIHWKQAFENMETGRPDDYKPVVVSVPRSIGGVLLGRA